MCAWLGKEKSRRKENSPLQQTGRQGRQAAGLTDSAHRKKAGKAAAGRSWQQEPDVVTRHLAPH